MKQALFLSLAALLAMTSSPRAQQARAMAIAQNEMPAALTMLVPTNHPPVPRDLSQLWLAPDRVGPASRSGSYAAVGAAAKLASRGEYSKALTAISQPVSQQGVLADYAAYYTGVSQLQLRRPADALKTFKALRSRQPIGFLAEAAALGEASADEALEDPAAAVAVYEQLLNQKPMHPDEVYMRLGLAAHLAHDRNKAADAFARVYYEFALSEHAAEAGVELDSLGLQPAEAGSDRYKLELGRAERIFGVKQYSAAREAFADLRARATGDDRALIQLRLAECDFFLKRTRAARDSLSALLDTSSRQAEALHYYGLASRDLGDIVTYFRTSRRIVDEFPSERWAEDALNELASYYIRKDDDAAADELFRELYQKYPRGAYAERAAWKVGWRSYRQKRYDETVIYFEGAALSFPRSDYRPSWLYWAGRAHERLDEKSTADKRYALVVTDYLNSYYGRLASKRLGLSQVAKIGDGSEGGGTRDITLSPALPPTAPLIRALLDGELYDDAQNELRYAQRTWGDTPALQATIAWTNAQQSVGKKGTEQFQLLRGSITQMRRAYPQFLTAGGEDLPRDVLTVIYPLAYWDLIKKYSTANGLDPYLVAALMAQESTFVADIRSHANAYGLMQLIPATARLYAKKLNVRYSSRILTDPELNIRMGTLHFADAIKEFGGVHLALATYNAGARPVKQWIAEHPGVEVEEFIDDIPYPETQNYVKRILGTADDYRRLYGK